MHFLAFKSAMKGQNKIALPCIMYTCIHYSIITLIHYRGIAGNIFAGKKFSLNSLNIPGDEIKIDKIFRLLNIKSIRESICAEHDAAARPRCQ